MGFAAAAAEATGGAAASLPVEKADRGVYAHVAADLRGTASYSQQQKHHRQPEQGHKGWR